MEPSFYTMPPTFPRIREKMCSYQALCNRRSTAVFPIGRSLLGRGIYAVRLGNPRRFSLFVGGVHGQEWLTVLLLFRFLDDLFSSITQNRPLADIQIKKALDHQGLVVVPALNPDGISIALEGASGAPGIERQITNLCGGDFSHWQANARGLTLIITLLRAFIFANRRNRQQASWVPVRANMAESDRKANRKRGPSAGLSVPSRCASCTPFIPREKRFTTNTANIRRPGRP